MIPQLVFGSTADRLPTTTDLANILKKNDRVYKALFDDGLAALLEKFSQADLSALETDGYLEDLMAIDNGDVQLQLHLLPVLAMFLGL